MVMKKTCLYVMMAAAVFGALLLGGCAKKAGPSGEVTIGLVTDVGGVNDQSFNQSAWQGLQRLQAEKSIKVSYIESRDESNYAPNIDTFIDQGTTLIWGVGFMLGNAFKQAGIDYPEQQFAIVDYAYAPADVPNDNVTGVVFAAEECSFLVGYIAGKMTRTGKVGHINGIGSPTMESFAVGYYAGVLTANPQVQIMGQYSGSFGDPAGGKNIANQYYAAGADIIYSAAGGTGAGAIESARERGLWAIGVDMDQNWIAPNNVMTSALKRVDVALFDVSSQIAAGNFQGGTTRLYNLANEGVGYATTGNHIRPDVIAEVEAIKNRIIAGEIKVPATAAQIEAMFPGRYNLPPQ